MCGGIFSDDCKYKSESYVESILKIGYW